MKTAKNIGFWAFIALAVWFIWEMEQHGAKMPWS